MGDRAHWDAVYGARTEAALTWFEPEARVSQDIIAELAPRDASVIDIGGGASRLVDGLVDEGREGTAVLDLSQAALAASRDRLGAAAGAVDWIVADITDWAPPRQWDVWHDRAVFHFLTAAGDRAAYFAALAGALAPGGHAIIMTFAPDGSETCSGLPVRRWSGEALAAEAAGHQPGLLTFLGSRPHLHVTPKGNHQSFRISLFRRWRSAKRPRCRGAGAVNLPVICFACETFSGPGNRISRAEAPCR